jgi:cysteine synthase
MIWHTLKRRFRFGAIHGRSAPMRSRMTLSFVGVSVVATMVVPGHCYGTVRTWEHQAAVGRTPLVDLSSLADLPAGVSVYGKAEFSNPSGSIKDRIVEFILDEHERTGKLVRHSGQTIVAASSGNTAAALAMFSAMRGYQCKLITNRKTSQEKIQQLGAYGAEVIITASGVPVDSPEHYQNVETRLVAENPSWIGLNQCKQAKKPGCSLIVAPRTG